MKTYSELIQIPDYAGRLEYLLLHGDVGQQTFGRSRKLNQDFYTSYEWRRFRRDIIVRDHGCDLGHESFPIMKGTKILIHHINPITVDDIVNRSDCLLDPENVISVAFDTHEAIHFGNKNMVLTPNIVTRSANDTCPWR